MTKINLAEVLFLVLALLIVSTIIFIRYKYRKLNIKKFQKKWDNLQKMCADKKLWYQVILEADGLLDEALKKKHFHGKTTGERLVAAQKIFSENSDVWYAHKFKNKIYEKQQNKISKKDTVKVLKAIRNALWDLNALPKPSGKENI